MYSYGPPHKAEQKQDGHLEYTYSSSVRIQDVALKTCQKRWTIGRSVERGSGISVLAARHDDDDDDFFWYWSKNLFDIICKKIYSLFCIIRQIIYEYLKRQRSQYWSLRNISRLILFQNNCYETFLWWFYLLKISYDIYYFFKKFLRFSFSLGKDNQMPYQIPC